MRHRNPRFDAGGRITCEIEHPVFGWVPFTVDPADTGATIDMTALHRMIVEGGEAAPFVPPSAAEVATQAAADARARRDRLLASEVDPVVSNPLRWADLGDARRAEWAAYRRALLDLPAQEGFPDQIVWPVRPAD